uniref:PilY1 beta-propeller domain-containing protein n=1 Tax=candidate division WOR-3 bacterium TaxID=2052148 RepID=A0A7V1EHC8_UNCW3
MRFVIIFLLFLGALFAQEMAAYCCAPPFVTTVVPPNIMIMLDNSGSMYDQAYGGNSLYMTDTTKWYGYFKPDSNYRWATNRFVSDPLGPFPGRILNWACMSRADIEKKVLTGGKGNELGNIVRLLSEGRYTWTKYYYRNASNYNTFSISHSADATYLTVSKYGSNPPINATLSNIRVQVDIPEKEYRGVLDQIGDKDDDRHWDDDAPIFGLWHFNYDRGGHIRDYLGEPDIIDLRNHINAFRGETWTPLAECYFELLHFFSQSSPHYYNSDYAPNPGNQHDPWYDKNTHTMTPCRRSFILVLTDGESTQDMEIPNSCTHLPNCNNLQNYWDGINPTLPDNGTDYLDDITLYGHVNDLRPDAGWGNRSLAGDQSIECYIIYTFGTIPAAINLLKDAAKTGGFADLNGNKRPDLAAEYDKNGDGIPDNYFQAETGYQLEEAIMKAIMQMLAKVSSASAAAVVSAGTKGAGLATQAQFYPRRQFTTGELLDWTGSVYSLWIDKFGLLREDNNQDHYLHLKNDYVVKVEFDTTVGDVRVKRYQDVNGDGDSLVYLASVALDELKTVWDGGKWLWNNSPDQRVIKAFVDANKNGIVDIGEFKDFIPANAGTFRPHLGVPTDQSADTVIRYVRGTDFTNLRSRTTNNKVWKLGDIINSSATVVSHPMERYDYLYGDVTYQDFWNAESLRRPVVYVGANDGMLHAFNAGYYRDIVDPDPFKVGYQDPLGAYSLGQELWAYIPYNLLAHLKWLKNPHYCHVYYVDLTPYPTDVKIFTPDAIHPQGWGTVLTVGMRLGGGEIRTATDTLNSAYAFIDVSDPLNPNPMWEFTHPNLKYTLTYPTAIKIANPIDTAWFMVTASGPINCAGESNQNARIYVLDISTGNIRRIFTVPDANSFVANIFGIDWDQDYSVDLIYFSDCFKDNTAPGGWGGKIYRIKTRKSTDPNDWVLSAVTENLKRPMIAEGNVTIDEFNRLWVYFGSGRFFSDVDEADTTTKQLFVGIKEDTVSTFTLASMYNVTNVWIDTSGDAHIGAVVKSFEEFMDDVYATNGWYRYFAKGGERSLTPALVFGGAVLFTTFVPTGDICSYGGYGNLYAMFYRTGTAHPESYLGDTLGAHRLYTGIGPGMPSEPALYVTADQTKVFIQTYGGIVQQETGLPTAIKPGVILWKGR